MATSDPSTIDEQGRVSSLPYSIATHEYPPSFDLALQQNTDLRTRLEQAAAWCDLIDHPNHTHWDDRGEVCQDCPEFGNRSWPCVNRQHAEHVRGIIAGIRKA